MTRCFVFAAFTLLLAACTSQVETNPPRSATEELLISTAAERAAQKMALALPQGSKIFLDAANFDSPDGKYAVAAIRGVLLRHKMLMADKRADAKVIISVRAGALATNQNTTLVGTPGFSVPVPLSSGSLPVPELALYKNSDQEGVAQFTAVAYDAKSGKLLADGSPQYATAHDMTQTVLFFISWSSNDIYPKEETADQVTPTLP